MHKIRRGVKYAAWYDEPDDEPGLLKNPFTKYKSNNPTSKLSVYRHNALRRALPLVNESADSKGADAPEQSALDPPASDPTRGNFDNTNEYVDVESTSSIKHPLRHRLLWIVKSLPDAVGRFFPSADAAEKQSAASSTPALRAAETAFMSRVKPQAILSELTFVQVKQDPSGSNDNVSAQISGMAQVAISSIQSVGNIDLETIRVSLPES
jgi:hypothetical protein